MPNFNTCESDHGDPLGFIAEVASAGANAVDLGSSLEADVATQASLLVNLSVNSAERGVLDVSI